MSVTLPNTSRYIIKIQEINHSVLCPSWLDLLHILTPNHDTFSNITLNDIYYVNKNTPGVVHECIHSPDTPIYNGDHTKQAYQGRLWLVNQAVNHNLM